MEFGQTSKTYSLNKSTYINLRWIGIIGQLITINSVKFIFGFEFDYIVANIICLLYTSPSPRDRTRSRMPSSA